MPKLTWKFWSDLVKKSQFANAVLSELELSDVLWKKIYKLSLEKKIYKLSFWFAHWIWKDWLNWILQILILNFTDVEWLYFLEYQIVSNQLSVFNCGSSSWNRFFGENNYIISSQIYSLEQKNWNKINISTKQLFNLNK